MVGGSSGLLFSALTTLTLLLLYSCPHTNADTSPATDSVGGSGIANNGHNSGTPPHGPEPSNCNCVLPSPPPPPPCKPTPEPPPPPPPPPREPVLPLLFENEKQRQAYYVIRRFKRTITCDPQGITKTWKGPKVCNYRGFHCATPPGTMDRTIASVDFNGYTLAAPTVDGFVNCLPDLAVFHANTNNFSGKVPNLSKLPYLYELDLSNNKFSGPFPAEVLRLSQLIFLDLRYNGFAGAVPPQVFSLDVTVLFLNNNPFNQPLPRELGNSNASYITLANNGFTGSIPSSIGAANSTLVEILFLNNRLSGCLPYQVGLLKNATVFDAGDNRITGTIPLAFGCLEKVEQLNLANNCLYGEIPEGVCRLPSLLNLSLSGNYFTSVGEACWNLIHKRVLDVRNNCIPGLPMQRPLWKCKSFASKPKSCPPLTYIPCKLHYQSAAEGRENPRALPAESSAADAVPTPSLAYSAVHRQGR